MTEIPAGGTEPVVRPEGPHARLPDGPRRGRRVPPLQRDRLPGDAKLRDRLGLAATLPGGHVHTPVLQFGAGNTDPATGAVTDAAFVRNRLDIVAQVRAIVAVAVGASEPDRSGRPGVPDRS